MIKKIIAGISVFLVIGAGGSVLAGKFLAEKKEKLPVKAASSANYDLLDATAYVDTTNGFSLNPPIGYAMAAGSDGSLVDFHDSVEDPEDILAETISVSSEPATAKDKEGDPAYIESKDALEQDINIDLPGFEIDSVYYVPDNGEKAQTATGTFKIENTELQTIVLVALKGDKLYYVLGIATKAAFPTYEETFTASLLSFKFT